MLDAIVPLVTLIALELILGIDNIIFISILSDRLPDKQRNKLRVTGLLLAMVMRLILLAAISWILKLDTREMDVKALSRKLILPAVNTSEFGEER